MKRRRKELNLTQQDLAKGICAQPLISKLENGDNQLSMQKLEKIAERLQLPLNELINQSMQESDTLVSPKVNTNFQLISEIRKLLEHRNYHALELLIEKHQEEINRASSNYEVTFFRWINATLYYHQYQDIQKALDMLEAIDISPKEQPELSLEIVNARVRLFYLDEQFGEALNIINQTIELTNNETIDFKIRAKFYLTIH
ncbi:helix-turn-helix transcriptional regulator [Dolosigranulum pigrum]|uniref:helix-turn-helix transcriptional regulator n=1 Tax=Dolosigranulum pigrum TaxID=29394 RepID=UPI00244E3B9E|nr:helix-turn-helix transcriptional regulator [Dolosigranulum pigrum]